MKMLICCRMSFRVADNGSGIAEGIELELENFKLNTNAK